VGALGRHLFTGFEERGNGQSKGEKSSSSLTSRVEGKKKGYNAIQNGTVLGFSLLLFLMNSV
jgi:hypothetical protein